MRHTNRSTQASGLALGFAASLIISLAHADTASPDQLSGVAAQCLTRKLAAAADTATVGELRAACATEKASVTASLGKEAPEGTVPPITHRLDAERDADTIDAPMQKVADLLRTRRVLKREILNRLLDGAAMSKDRKCDREPRGSPDSSFRPTDLDQNSRRAPNCAYSGV